MRKPIWLAVAIACLHGAVAAQVSEKPSNELPGVATAELHESLEAAGSHAAHVWRDTPPTTADGDVNAYVEIPRGERRKWEFDMRANARAIDRLMPAEVGGYPVNYGFVPQTVSYDGDPFDVLVLGPPLPGGRIVRGRIVGLMIMEDEKGADSKVVVSPFGRNGKPSHELTDAERNRIAEYFRRYKRHDPATFSKVPGWGQASDGRAHVDMTHAFFLKCRAHANTVCRLD